MASKFHPLVDGFNRHLRKESREPQSLKTTKQPSAEDSVRIADQHGIYDGDGTNEAQDRNSRRRDQASLSRVSVQAITDQDVKSQPFDCRRRPPDGTPSDGGGSVGSTRLKRLSLRDSINLNCNKRPAVDPAYGSLPGDARPTKLRSPPSDDPRSLAHSPHGASNYDPAADQRPHARHSSDDDKHNSPQPTNRQPGLIARQNIRSPFPSTPNYASLNNEAEISAFSPPSASPTFSTLSDKDSGMLLQPETRPITQEQLVNEVKGIYAGLVMVEKKCVEIDQQQAMTTNKLSHEQWQALIALHRTLLHEHHDFFLASQHPSSSPALRRLATTYAMPARMWRHGIHSFLELLRHRLPDSLDHMLAFVYLAYSMMALLMESIPSFEETWIECLGDLARYRMAIEEADLRDREVWSGVARMWYNKAADKSPNVGRIQHHLAVLARPNIVQQLFYYSKALVSAVPFHNARESVMLLFNPFLEGSEIVSQRYPIVESAFIKAQGILFTRGSIEAYLSLRKDYVSFLDSHIGRVNAKFRVQGPEMASTICAAMLDFGNADSFIVRAFRTLAEQAKLEQHLQSSPGPEQVVPQDPQEKESVRRQKWTSIQAQQDLTRADHPTMDSITKDTIFCNSRNVEGHACHTMNLIVTAVFQRIGDKNILPFAHVLLAFIFSLTFVPDALIYIEDHIPWESVVTFLNTLSRSGVVEARLEDAVFPQPLSGTGRQLPEDFSMRGLLWAQYYFPPGFFEGQLVDDDERTLELPSHAAPRAERCLWLGIQLASLHRWIRYDGESKQFSLLDAGGALKTLSNTTLDPRSPTMSVESDVDSNMVDAKS